VDGLQYRELKATLKVSDGKLISNLNQLRNMGYVKKSTARLERKKLDIYYLTPEGKKELVKVVKWMKLIQEVTKDGDLECQTTLTK
jgi:DNA-binding PadR family transcriptional regulator